jgi:hypothetical protein
LKGLKEALAPSWVYLVPLTGIAGSDKAFDVCFHSPPAKVALDYFQCPFGSRMTKGWGVMVSCNDAIPEVSPLGYHNLVGIQQPTTPPKSFMKGHVSKKSRI